MRGVEASGGCAWKVVGGHGKCYRVGQAEVEHKAKKGAKGSYCGCKPEVLLGQFLKNKSFRHKPC